jgi:hypothetical protein
MSIEFKLKELIIIANLNIEGKLFFHDDKSSTDFDSDGFLKK